MGKEESERVSEERERRERLPSDFDLNLRETRESPSFDESGRRRESQLLQTACPPLPSSLWRERSLRGVSSRARVSLLQKEEDFFFFFSQTDGDADADD